MSLQIFVEGPDESSVSQCDTSASIHSDQDLVVRSILKYNSCLVPLGGMRTSLVLN